MALNKLLTEAHWKAQGLPRRSMAEKLKTSKTGISEALRALAQADKALMADILDADLAKKMGAALDNLAKVLKALKAENKDLIKLRSQMEDAIEAHRKDHNADINKLERSTLGGLPGGIKSLQRQAAKEFSNENLAFYDAATRISSDPVKIIELMKKMGSDLNTPNEAVWPELTRDRERWVAEGEAWEKRVKLELKASIKAVVSNMDDTLDRLKRSALL